MSYLPEKPKMSMPAAGPTAKTINHQATAIKIYQEYLNLRLDLDRHKDQVKVNVEGLFRIDSIESFLEDLSEKGTLS